MFPASQQPALAEVVRRARYLLLDFDGPVCSLFAGYPAAEIADEMHVLIRSYLDGAVPPNIEAAAGDPLDLLCEAAELGNDKLTRLMADACRDAEVAAAVTATPTPGAAEFLEAAHETGRPVIIVSNNATEAVNAYLAAHGLGQYVSYVSARFDGMDPRRLKPDPFLLHRGLINGGADGTESVFIGDSSSDVTAGLAVHIPTVGYANKPNKAQRLTEAGAAAVIDSMTTLAVALRRVPLGTHRNPDQSRIVTNRVVPAPPPHPGRRSGRSSR